MEIKEEREIATRGFAEDSAVSSKDGSWMLKGFQLMDKFRTIFARPNIVELIASRARGDQAQYLPSYNKPNCEVLTPGSKEWQKGRLRLQVQVNVTIEFIPDEPETTEAKSPLDDFR